MIIRLTEHLAHKIRIRISNLHPLHANAFTDWTAHLLRANRRSFLLAMNTKSLYCVIAPAEGIVSPLVLEARLYAHIKYQLNAEGFEFFCRRLLDRDGEETQFSKPLSAKSEGTLKDFAEMVEYYISEEHLGPEAVAAKLNGTILSVLDHQCPRQTFKTMGF